eukprot:4108695-Pyramimonas_sp.AAC.1
MQRRRASGRRALAPCAGTACPHIGPGGTAARLGTGARRRVSDWHQDRTEVSRLVQTHASPTSHQRRHETVRQSRGVALALHS